MKKIIFKQVNLLSEDLRKELNAEGGEWVQIKLLDRLPSDELIKEIKDLDVREVNKRVVKKLVDLEGDWSYYKKKPIVVKATEVVEDRVKIETREGFLYGYKGDFIIQGLQGEIYPCGRDIFFETYECCGDE